MKQKKMITLGNYELLDACLKDVAVAKGVSESAVTEEIFMDYFLSPDKDYRDLVSNVLYKGENGVSLTLEQFTLLTHKISSLTTESLTELLRFAYNLEIRYRTRITDPSDPVVNSLVKRARAIKDLIPKREWLDWELINDLSSIQTDVEGFNSCSYFAQYIEFVIEWWDRSVPNPHEGAPDIQISSIKYIIEILSLIFRLSHYPTIPETRCGLARVIKNLKFKE